MAKAQPTEQPESKAIPGKKLSNGLHLLHPEAVLAVGPHGEDAALYLAGSTIVCRGITVEKLLDELISEEEES